MSHASSKSPDSIYGELLEFTWNELFFNRCVSIPPDKQQEWNSGIIITLIISRSWIRFFPDPRPQTPDLSRFPFPVSSFQFPVSSLPFPVSGFRVAFLDDYIGGMIICVYSFPRILGISGMKSQTSTYD